MGTLVPEKIGVPLKMSGDETICSCACTAHLFAFYFSSRCFAPSRTLRVAPYNERSAAASGFSGGSTKKETYDMDDTPDYQRYSLEELYDVAQHISKEKYPERYTLVKEQILIREKNQASNPAVFQEVQTGGCAHGCIGSFVGASLGAAAPILWVSLFPPPPVPNMDGLNQWGGLVGSVMLGILVGGVGGACIGASRRR
jgi:hypothetical protein